MRKTALVLLGAALYCSSAKAEMGMPAFLERLPSMDGTIAQSVFLNNNDIEDRIYHRPLPTMPGELYGEEIDSRGIWKLVYKFPVPNGFVKITDGTHGAAPADGYPERIQYWRGNDKLEDIAVRSLPQEEQELIRSQFRRVITKHKGMPINGEVILPGFEAYATQQYQGIILRTIS